MTLYAINPVKMHVYFFIRSIRSLHNGNSQQKMKKKMLNAQKKTFVNDVIKF